MRYFNAYVFQGKERFVKGGLRVSDGRIAEVIRDNAGSQGDPGPRTPPELPVSEEETDLRGMYVIPGLVDIHSHGNSGHDFSDGDPEGLKVMGRFDARHGITSFLPTSMTLP